MVLERLTVCFIAATMFLITNRAAADEQEILVGRTSAGTLVVRIEFDEPLVLPVSVFPGIPGYATGAVGFHSTILDEPTNDFFQLSTAADFRLILLDKDPGMEIWNGTGYMAVGDSFYVGPSPFDTHPVWDLVSGTPGIAYSLTLKLHDLNGVYPDSDPFQLSFTAVRIQYELNLVPIDSLHAMLLWATNAVGWSLETNPSRSGTNWMTITNAPVVAGTNFTLNINTSAGQAFFRLRQP